MPFQRTRARLVLTAEVESRLSTLAHSRTASAQQVERAQILLAYAAGESISAIARRLHGSWLNLVESFFAKLTKTLLRGIRGASKAELRERIERHLQELNQEPVVMKWTYGLESLSVA